MIPRQDDMPPEPPPDTCAICGKVILDEEISEDWDGATCSRSCALALAAQTFEGNYEDIICEANDAPLDYY